MILSDIIESREDVISILTKIHKTWPWSEPEIDTTAAFIKELKKLGWSRTGRGRFAQVFTKDGFDDVAIKVVFDSDWVFMAYAKKCAQNWLWGGRRNPHFLKCGWPKKLSDGFVVAMERLDVTDYNMDDAEFMFHPYTSYLDKRLSAEYGEQVGPDGEPNIAKMPWDFYDWDHDKGNPDVPSDEIVEFSKRYPKMKQAIKSVSSINGPYAIDLHPRNWGIRKNGDLVMTDPVAGTGNKAIDVAGRALAKVSPGMAAALKGFD